MSLLELLGSLGVVDPARANSRYIVLAVWIALGGLLAARSFLLLAGYHARRQSAAAPNDAQLEAIAGTRRRDAARQPPAATVEDDPFLYRLARASEPATDEAGLPVGTVGSMALGATQDLGCVDGAYRGVAGLDDTFVHLSVAAQARRERAALACAPAPTRRLSRAAGGDDGVALLQGSG